MSARIYIQVVAAYHEFDICLAIIVCVDLYVYIVLPELTADRHVLEIDLVLKLVVEVSGRIVGVSLYDLAVLHLGYVV